MLVLHWPAILPVGYLNLRKTIFQQQLQNQLRVLAICLLLGYRFVWISRQCLPNSSMAYLASSAPRNLGTSACKDQDPAKTLRRFISQPTNILLR